MDNWLIFQYKIRCEGGTQEAKECQLMDSGLNVKRDKVLNACVINLKS